MSKLDEETLQEMSKLDEETLQEMRECYSVFDRVGDMKVEADRLIDVLRSLGLNPPTNGVKDVLEGDKLTGTRVDFETFCQVYQEFKKREDAQRPTIKDIVEALSAFDNTQTGMIPIGEFRHILTNLGDKMTEEQVEDIYKEHEASGVVPYQQIVITVLSGV